MDMKRILQAMDGVATKPVEGANSMAKFLRVVSEVALPTAPKFSITQTSYDSLNEPPDFTVTNIERGVEVASFGSEQEARAYVSQQDPAGAPQTTLHQAQSTTTAPEANPDQPIAEEAGMSRLLSIMNEGANPHKVALPVQMAMQHYATPKEVAVKKPSLLKGYLSEVHEEIAEEAAHKRQLMNQYAQTIAERVLMKESKQEVAEAPIEMTGDANDPTIYGHEKANPMSLKGRIMSARAQLKELAQLADSDSLVAWEEICKKSKGGMFMGLEQNLEQIRHGISELAAKRKQGGVASRGIDKNIGEDNDPCWKDYKQVGMKKKGGKQVPNCVPKE